MHRNHVMATVLNTTGQVIRSAVLNKTVSELPLTDLAAGSYFVNFTGPKGSYTLQFVKN